MLSLRGKEDLEQKCSEPLPRLGIVNKDLLLPALIVWSFIKAPCGQAPVYSVTLVLLYFIIHTWFIRPLIQTLHLFTTWLRKTKWKIPSTKKFLKSYGAIDLDLIDCCLWNSK